MRAKKEDSVIMEAILPLIIQVPDDKKHQIYPVIYNGLVSWNLIKEKITKPEDEDRPGGFDYSKIPWYEDYLRNLENHQ